MYKTQKQHAAFWRNRKIDWKESYFDTWNHPHRMMLVKFLSGIRFSSIVEFGCASGPNLYLVSQKFPRAEIGGADINKQAIETARALLPRTAVLIDADLSNVFFGDKSADVVLSDMALIYVSNIRKALREMKRVGHRRIVLFEFHSTSFLARMALKWSTGYRAYNYKKLLESEGFTDVELTKIPEEMWPGGEPQKTFGYFITAYI